MVLELNRKFPTLETDEYRVMPNHFSLFSIDLPVYIFLIAVHSPILDTLR